jgi:hypothetical protein
VLYFDFDVSVFDTRSCSDTNRKFVTARGQSNSPPKTFTHAKTDFNTGMEQFEEPSMLLLKLKPSFQDHKSFLRQRRP